MSSGVARKAGEWSHVQVSAEVTFLPKRWFADEAQRAGEKLRHCAPSPSGRSTKALLESVTAGEAHVWGGEKGFCGPPPSPTWGEKVPFLNPGVVFPPHWRGVPHFATHTLQQT